MEDDKQKIAIHYACGNKNITTEMLKYLIEAKSEINKKTFHYNILPLHLLCQNESFSFDKLKLLLKINRI